MVATLPGEPGAPGAVPEGGGASLRPDSEVESGTLPTRPSVLWLVPQLRQSALPSPGPKCPLVLGAAPPSLAPFGGAGGSFLDPQLEGAAGEAEEAVESVEAEEEADGAGARRGPARRESGVHQTRKSLSWTGTWSWVGTWTRRWWCWRRRPQRPRPAGPPGCCHWGSPPCRPD